jgi:UDP-galactopyranose mutase
VLAEVDGQQVPIPINLTTLNELYGLQTGLGGRGGISCRTRDTGLEIRSSRDVVVSQVGEELYRKFFEGYTRKQWGRDASNWTRR